MCEMCSSLLVMPTDMLGINTTRRMKGRRAGLPPNRMVNSFVVRKLRAPLHSLLSICSGGGTQRLPRRLTLSHTQGVAACHGRRVRCHRGIWNAFVRLVSELNLDTGRALSSNMRRPGISIVIFHACYSCN